MIIINHFLSITIITITINSSNKTEPEAAGSSDAVTFSWLINDGNFKNYLLLSC